MPIERIKSKLSDILYVKSYSCYNITKKMTVLQKLSLQKVSTTKGIATKGIGYQRFQQQKVSETKGVDFHFSLGRPPNLPSRSAPPPSLVNLT